MLSRSSPLILLNESDILLSHKPDPLSYFYHDTDPLHPHSHSHPNLILLHLLFLSFAFWFLLPALIAMRIARNRWRPFIQLAFLSTIVIGTLFASVYRKLTPDLYQGSKHGSFGYSLVFLSFCLALAEFFKSLLLGPQSPSPASSSSSSSSSPLSWRSLFSRLVPTDIDRSYSHLHHPTLSNLEQDIHPLKPLYQDDVPQRPHHVRFDSEDFDSPRTTFDDARSESTLDGMAHLSRMDSYDSQLSLSVADRTTSFSNRVLRFLFVSLERSLVVFAFIQFLSGVSVYTGICRDTYINGCLAHMIKGGIFWCYGILTFARFLGVYADMGWAWNYLPPATRPVTAEFVESLIIFIYGVTNTWMERFGAEAGSAFTTKQVQHISIAVMFCFGGLIGMAIESRTFRRWLGSAAAMSIKPGSEIIEPKAYSGSFNPVPAIVIGITGAAMGAHHQTYLFQVQIHQLWGNFLVGFAILRCLTYFFVWLRPAHSILPSRPPTELVASFLLACGGLTFIFSTEQITFAAMRRGHADVMMFLNITVATTFLAFCWILCVLSFKGWLTLRERHQVGSQ